MKRLSFGFALLLLVTGVALARLPNHNKTPGAANPDVTQENIHQTICVSG